MERALAKQDDKKAAALAWDQGCAGDVIRNDFIVPSMVSIFASERPARILDVGAGTGYIARAIDAQLTYRPIWTLLDIDDRRIEVALSLTPANMQANGVVSKISDFAAPEDYQAVMLTFTLLEAEDSAAMINDAVRLLDNRGVLVIAIPDVWRDALELADEEPTAPFRLLSETLDLSKTDKFTGAPYPFYAMRTETLISSVLGHPCVLERLSRGGPQDEAYLLVFRKLTTTSAGY
jgi:SAM-dependent methyltransferase